MLTKLIPLFAVLLLYTKLSSISSATIEIPSNHEMMGIHAPKYSYPITKELWDRLYKPGGFTDQTLANFENGNPRGIFIVHSLEDIMGAIPCFVKMWNENHPNDQRHLKEMSANEFHELFSDAEFVSHYGEYVLAQRYLISGSVVAFNEEPQFILGETFAPVSFILKVPSECIVVTSIDDAHTDVNYAPLSETNGESEKSKYNRQTQAATEKLYGLDYLIRFPKIMESSYHTENTESNYYTEMNEVAFLSCALNTAGTQYRPEIAGVLINHDKKFTSMDYGNSARNQKYIDAAKGYARFSGLQIIEINKKRAGFSQEAAHRIITDWFDFPPRIFSEDHTNYCMFRHSIPRSYLTEEQISIISRGRQRYKEVLRYLPDVQYNSSGESICSPESRRNALEQVFKEIPEYKEAYELANSLTVKAQTFQLSAEQLAVYGIVEQLTDS